MQMKAQRIYIFVIMLKNERLEVEALIVGLQTFLGEGYSISESICMLCSEQKIARLILSKAVAHVCQIPTREAARILTKLLNSID